MEQWRILKDRNKCDKPGCPLAAAEEYYAILKLPECLRLERCEACFAETAAGAEVPFHWKVRRTTGADQQPVLDLESLRQLFDRLGEVGEDVEDPGQVGHVEDAAAAAGGGGDGGAAADTAVDTGAPGGDQAAGLRYLVALLLLRKRRLKMVDPQTPEQEAADLLVVDPKIAEMEPVALFAPDLDSGRLDGLRDELMAALGE